MVDQEFAQLKQVLHGVSLLGQCPDSVNAAIICRGEKLSIAIMEGVFRAKGYPVTVINPVEKLLAQGHYRVHRGHRRVHAAHRRGGDPGRPYRADGRFHRR